jgi:hypothetical protein
MPLIDLLNSKSDFLYYYGGPGNFTQRSLPFDKDMPGAGNSGLPYIKFPIDSAGIKDDFKKYYSTNRTGLDFPTRGGSLVFDLGDQTFTPSADFDKERIKKFLKSDPRGKSFLLKQEGLQLSNPKTQTGDTIYTLRLNSIPGLIENTRVFNNGKNLLQQVGVQGTGTHITRNGVLPYNPLAKYYQDVVGAEKSMTNAEASENNRLLILASLKMKQKNSKNQISTVGSVENITAVNRLGISLNRGILFEYIGGPGSVYGVGKTTIRRSKDWDTTEAINFKSAPMTTLAMTYDTIMKQNSSRANITNGIVSNYGDFRDSIDGYSGKKISGSNWGNIDSQKVDYRFFVPGTRVDKMNTLKQFNFDSDKDPWTENDASDDIIKFVFECIDNSDTSNSVALFFRAHLTSITDSNSGQWNGFKYMGRGENFYTYGGFDRTIGFGFKIAVGSKDELNPVYEKLNWLMSQVYPDYSSQNYMRAPIIKLTIGDYLYRVPGFLENVNFTIDQASPWEIDNGSQLPHYIDVSTSFKPILNQLPRKQNINKQGQKINGVDLIRQKRRVANVVIPEPVQQPNITPEPVNLNLTQGNTLTGLQNQNQGFDVFGTF